MKKLPALLCLLSSYPVFADIGNSDYGDALFLVASIRISFIFSCISGICILLYMLLGWQSRLHKAFLFIYAIIPAIIYTVFFTFHHYYREQYTRPGDPAAAMPEQAYVMYSIAAGFVFNIAFIIWQCSKPARRKKPELPAVL